MQVSLLELVYRVRVMDCLFIPPPRHQVQLHASNVERVRCGSREYIVPVVPGHLVAEVLGIKEGEGVVVSSLRPPCELLDELLESKGFVELGDFLEYRVLRLQEGVVGATLTCPLLLVKDGVILEGSIVVRKPCEHIELVQSIALRLEREGLWIGYLRSAGCGYLKLVSRRFILDGEEVGFEKVVGSCS